ncbi:MAG: hypothetical protein IJG62_04265, partial [Synergistaceae bacterium]|nr:hypothetical protein [Synergistaceae bacterium]
MKIKLVCCLIFIITLSSFNAALAAEPASQSLGLNAPANLNNNSLSTAVLNSNPDFNDNIAQPSLTEQKSAKDNLPDKVSLSANRMRFDSQTGDFLAEGNV